MRLNCSKDEDFDDAVKQFAKAFAFKILMESKKINRENVLRNMRPGRRRKSNKKDGRKLFWISPFDPRMVHPRKILSRNYHLFAGDPNFAKIFPRKNLIAGCRRLPNLLETVV